MGIDTKEKTVLNPSVGADGGQPIHNNELSISDCGTDCNDEFDRLLRKMAKMNDPANLSTVTMQELYETVYQAKPPVIDGLLYPGIYLLAGAPKVGKSFFVAQIAYHVSTGRKLWEYDVRSGTVLYLALKVQTSSILPYALNSSEMDWTNSLKNLCGSIQIPGLSSLTLCKRLGKWAVKRTVTPTIIRLPAD